LNNAINNPGRVFEQLEQLRAENVRLKAELEAARQVADAALWYLDYDGDSAELDADAWCELADAVREYRAANPPLSPEKQAVIERTVDKTDEEWQEVCKCC